jgi:Co/Zn/Cd efflux system component
MNRPEPDTSAFPDSGPDSDFSMAEVAKNGALRRVVLIVAFLNLAYFGVEFAVARQIGSVSLLADSIDFLEDASVNLLIALALGWSLAARSRVGMLMAVVLLVPGLATLWMAWQKFNAPVPPEAWALSAAAVGALVVNLSCAAMLARFRQQGGSLTRAAFLSARNDAYANLAIIGAAGATAFTASGWPDLIVGLCIAAMNADAAWEVWEAARQEQAEAAHNTRA